MAENISNLGQLSAEIMDKNQNNLEQTVDTDLADKFDRLLSQRQEINANPSNNILSTTESTMTLGDQILSSMQKVKDRVDAGHEQVQDLFKTPDTSEVINMKQMFQTQLAITNLMITEDYIGKIVSKSTQSFETLLRNQ